MHGYETAHNVLQLAVIILSAKLMGRLFSQYLKQPSVVGELLAGVIIGPFALGGIHLFGMSPLFPAVAEGVESIPAEIRLISMLAAAVLLFQAGLETDLQKFLRFAPAGLATGLGGGIFSFLLGDGVTVWLGVAPSYTSPAALFMGTVAMATSVGLTARVLSEKKKMDTAEGSTILSSAVIDDVLALAAFAIVLAMITNGGEAHSTDAWRVARLFVAALLFFASALALGMLGSRVTSAFLRFFGGRSATATAALALGFLVGAIAEKSGLALIIGAYLMGIALSRLDMVHEIQHRLTNIYDLLVPVFFCVTGMKLDVSEMGGAMLLGLLFTIACLLGKAIGCGAPALLLGFNIRGAARIGIGMVPRQEVALIIGGMGLAGGAISQGAFGAIILMALVSTLITPGLLARVFGDESGLRKGVKEPRRATEQFELHLPGEQVSELVAQRMVDAFRQEEFFVHHRPDLGTYEMRKADIIVFMTVGESKLYFSASPEDLQYVRLIVLDEMLALRQIFQQASSVAGSDELRRLMLGEDQN